MASMSSNNLSSLYGLALLLTWCHTALFFHYQIWKKRRWKCDLLEGRVLHTAELLITSTVSNKTSF